MLQLSKRLLAVAGLAGSARVLADVGTDHGYIPVFLAQSGRIQKAIAMDVNEGPLNRAREHIRQYGLQERIETRRCDGLSALVPGEADTIVIAGMGGALMMRILSQGEAPARAAERLVLQPQSEIYAFRRFLMERGYKITAEEMVREEEKYYAVMAAEYRKEAVGALEFSEAEQKYGPLLLKDRHPVLLQYLQYQKEQKEKILRSLEANARQDVSGRRNEIMRELAELGEILQIWKEQVV